MNRLRIAAIVAFSLHLLAGLGMALILSQGLETNADFHARLNFLVEHRILWGFAWLTLSAAALSILYFYVVFAAAHRTDNSASEATLRLAVLLSAAGIAPDLAAQAVEIGVLPAVAARALVTDAGVELFLLIHRIDVMMSGYLANGLFSISALILSLSTRRWYSWWVWSAGAATGISGFVLSAAALLDSPSGMFWSNVILVPCILFWLAAVAHSTGAASADSLTNPVLLYDGVCGFCNKTVQLILRHDRRATMRFAPLQSNYGQRILADHPRLQGMDSVVVVKILDDQEHVLVRSEAALSVATYLGGVWKLLLIFRIIPRPIRDFFYDLFARYRYKLFGKYDHCLLPSPDVRSRFLDTA